MLNPQKIKWMTKASIYEQEEKEVFWVNRYFKGDYICYGMIKAAIGLTIGTLLIVALWALVNAETLMMSTPLEELIGLGIQTAFYYAVALIVCLCIAFFVYLIRYQKMQKKKAVYLDYLNKIKKIQDKEKRLTESVREEHETW